MLSKLTKEEIKLIRSALNLALQWNDTLIDANDGQFNKTRFTNALFSENAKFKRMLERLNNPSPVIRLIDGKIAG